jgi:hypothetical protein
MKINVEISIGYVVLIISLWAATIASAIWGLPIWLTIGLMCWFLIRSCHEWVHALVALMNGLDVDSVYLDYLGKNYTLFYDSDDPKVTAKVFLSGALWDTFFYGVATASALVNAYYSHDLFAYLFGGFNLFMIFLTFVMSGSDWREFLTRTILRV